MTPRAQALALAAVAVMGGTVLYLCPPAQTPWYPSCPFRLLTGWQCAGCGELRAFHALLHGRFTEAFGCNGFAIALLPLAAALFVWELYSALRWDRFRRVPGLMPALAGLGGAALVFSVLRNAVS